MSRADRGARRQLWKCTEIRRERRTSVHGSERRRGNQRNGSVWNASRSYHWLSYKRRFSHSSADKHCDLKETSWETEEERMVFVLKTALSLFMVWFLWSFSQHSITSLFSLTATTILHQSRDLVFVFATGKGLRGLTCTHIELCLFKQKVLSKVFICVDKPFLRR